MHQLPKAIAWNRSGPGRDQIGVGMGERDGVEGGQVLEGTREGGVPESTRWCRRGQETGEGWELGKGRGRWWLCGAVILWKYCEELIIRTKKRHLKGSHSHKRKTIPKFFHFPNTFCFWVVFRNPNRLGQTGPEALRFGGFRGPIWRYSVMKLPSHDSILRAGGHKVAHIACGHFLAY